MKILVIDDSADCLELTEAALRSGGFDDISALGSARDGLEYLGLSGADKSMPVDLILLDIVMPEMDGIEACGCIRADTRYANVPIIMVTSLADKDSLSSAFAAGANDYIAKPIDRVELVARVGAALKVKAAMDGLRAREQELLDLLRDKN